MDKDRKKDMECLHCTKFFDCDGKPKDVKGCLVFEERRKDGEQENVHNENC